MPAHSVQCTVLLEGKSMEMDTLQLLFSQPLGPNVREYHAILRWHRAGAAVFPVQVRNPRRTGRRSLLGTWLGQDSVRWSPELLQWLPCSTAVTAQSKDWGPGPSWLRSAGSSHTGQAKTIWAAPSPPSQVKARSRAGHLECVHLEDSLALGTSEHSPRCVLQAGAAGSIFLPGLSVGTRGSV